MSSFDFKLASQWYICYLSETSLNSKHYKASVETSKGSSQVVLIQRFEDLSGDSFIRLFSWSLGVEEILEFLDGQFVVDELDHVFCSALEIIVFKTRLLIATIRVLILLFSSFFQWFLSGVDPRLLGIVMTHNSYYFSLNSFDNFVPLFLKNLLLESHS